MKITKENLSIYNRLYKSKQDVLVSAFEFSCLLEKQQKNEQSQLIKKHTQTYYNHPQSLCEFKKTVSSMHSSEQNKFWKKASNPSLNKLTAALNSDQQLMTDHLAEQSLEQTSEEFSKILPIAVLFSFGLEIPLYYYLTPLLATYIHVRSSLICDTVKNASVDQYHYIDGEDLNHSELNTKLLEWLEIDKISKNEPIQPQI